MKSSRQTIEKLVELFYQKAISDFLIGYQFRKIARFEGHDPLSPPIEAFASHLPRISDFWEIQLLGQCSRSLERPFDLKKIHHQLNLNRGELDRWLMLFRQSIEEFQENPNREKYEIFSPSMLSVLEIKLRLFENKFLSFYFSDGGFSAP